MSVEKGRSGAITLNARTLRTLFPLLYEHLKKEYPKVIVSNLALPADSGQLVHGKVTLVHGHWTEEPQSAHLHLEDLPVVLNSGKGSVDFIVLIMPIKPAPKVLEVNVIKVSKHTVTDIDEFIREFCDEFKSEWNGA